MAETGQVSKKRRVDQVGKGPSEKTVIQVNLRSCFDELCLGRGCVVESRKVDYFEIPKMLDPEFYTVQLFVTRRDDADEFLRKFVIRPKGITVQIETVTDLEQMPENAFQLVQDEDSETDWFLVKCWTDAGSFVPLNEIFHEKLFGCKDTEGGKEDEAGEE